MSKEKIIGHETIENGQYLVVVQRSERPLGGLLGFIFGTLISLLFIEAMTIVQIATVLLFSALAGYIFSRGQTTREVLKHRVVSITRKRNYVAVYYVLQDTRMVGSSRIG